MPDPIVEATPGQTLDYLVMKFESDIANLKGQRDAVIASNEQIIVDFDMRIAEVQKLIETVQSINPDAVATNTATA